MRIGRPRTVLFVAFPDMCLLDMTGPHTSFWAAGVRLRQLGLPAYDCHTVSLHGGLVRTVEGVELHTRPVSDFARKQVDTVVVPGSPNIAELIDDAGPLADWLGKVAKKARRMASVCTGAFYLAKAGLLHNRRAATHWGMCELLQSRFPALAVDADAIFVRADNVWTSAGVTAGIDLALAMIEEDCGRDVSLFVARELVVFLKRSGGQSQHSALLQAQTEDGGATFDELHAWMADNLGSALSVEELAVKANMSPRNFARVYKQKTGRTPAKAVEVMRLEAARRMLEDSDRNIDQIARQCGFGDEERMRLTFQRNLSVSPRDYRKRFAG
ncbi:GlxA family transcriptional regulator [Archangium lansingense]|uniref:GlxA family transcriptional regulator n=1 Tax=Archangium lansingense TaxID=2995310 RepID=UPI003B7D086F